MLGNQTRHLDFYIQANQLVDLIMASVCSSHLNDQTKLNPPEHVAMIADAH